MMSYKIVKIVPFTVHIPTERIKWFRGPGFLAVAFTIRLNARLLPLSRQQPASLFQSSSVSPVDLTDWRGGGGRKAESEDRKKS